MMMCDLTLGIWDRRLADINYYYKDKAKRNQRLFQSLPENQKCDVLKQCAGTMCNCSTIKFSKIYYNPPLCCFRVSKAFWNLCFVLIHSRWIALGPLWLLWCLSSLVRDSGPFVSVIRRSLELFAVQRPMLYCTAEIPSQMNTIKIST